MNLALQRTNVPYAVESLFYRLNLVIGVLKTRCVETVQFFAVELRDLNKIYRNYRVLSVNLARFTSWLFFELLVYLLSVMQMRLICDSYFLFLEFEK